MRDTKVSIGGGTYLLMALGVGLSVSNWGGEWWWALLSGLFWPTTLGYWLAQALHTLAGR
jgi:hypothetical protein